MLKKRDTKLRGRVDKLRKTYAKMSSNARTKEISDLVHVHGVPQQGVARVVGISRQRVHQITRGYASN
jgi:DNA-directed RNA polymerase specialized sigma subunit